MCFSLSWLEQVLIWIVWLAVAVGVLKLLVPWVLSLVGANTGPLIPILQILIWGAIAIFVIGVVFSLLQCMGGVHFPRLG